MLMWLDYWQCVLCIKLHEENCLWRGCMKMVKWQVRWQKWVKWKGHSADGRDAHWRPPAKAMLWSAREISANSSGSRCCTIIRVLVWACMNVVCHDLYTSLVCLQQSGGLDPLLLITTSLCKVVAAAVATRKFIKHAKHTANPPFCLVFSASSQIPPFCCFGPFPARFHVLLWSDAAVSSGWY